MDCRLQKKHRTALFRGVLLALVSLGMGGCNSTCCIGKRSCCDFGRGPILCSKADCVIDYNDCFQEICVGKEESCMDGLRKAPLADEMFDPYAPIDPHYTLSKGDILQISVFGEEETAVENAMIAPDGKIYYTVLEGVQAEGRTPGQVAKDLERQLDELFLHPVVTVVPKVSQGLNFRVLGRVQQPGEYPITGPVTISEAVSEAGGLLTPASKEGDSGRRYMVPYVDLNESFIVRGNRKLDVNFNKLLLEGDNRENIYVRPNDYIYIAGSEIKEVFILGYVTSPQRLPYVNGMTLMSSLASVGGWQSPNPYSPDLANILVIRGSLDCPRVCHVNLENILCGIARDVYLQPGDIVYASHKQFRFLREMFLLAISAFTNSFASSAGDYYGVKWFSTDTTDDDTGGTDGD